MRWFGYACLVGLSSLLACNGSDQPAGGGGTTATGSGGHGAGSNLPPPVCHTGGTVWKDGTQAFQEATSKWGLDTLGAVGVRVSAVDFDGDGWADLVVRLNGARDDFSAGGKRTTWLLRNTHDGGFEDVTQSSGIRQNRTDADPTKGRPGEVFAFGDVNNDGHLDVITGWTTDTGNPTLETTELLFNDGDGTFSLGPAENAFRRKTDAVASVTLVDFDRDGNLDVWIVENSLNSTPLQDRLYKGDGAGHFVEVTKDRGLTTKSWASLDDLNKARCHTVGWAGNACDLNNDGAPELLASSYGRAPNHLWRSTGQAGGFTFVNQSVASGYAFDGNQDWHDNESARCWCKLHPSDTGCAGVPAPQYIACTKDADAFRWDNQYDQEPFRLGGNSAATMCADVDNDGWLDLVTSEIVHWDVGESSDQAELLLNTKSDEVVFQRPGNAVTGLARSYPSLDWNEGIMSGSVFDFDNDGWADIYFGDSDYPYDHGWLFHQGAPGHFALVPLAQGIDHHRSHGSAVADFDHDGDLDIVVGHSFARCHQAVDDDSECYATQQVRFFENVLGDKGNFLTVRLVGGAGSNRAAIGARVTVKAGGVTQTRDVEGGHGHYGAQDDLSLLFGLGAACEADVTVRWPNADSTTETVHLPAGHRFILEQGKDPVVDK